MDGVGEDADEDDEDLILPSDIVDVDGYDVDEFDGVGEDVGEIVGDDDGDLILSPDIVEVDEPVASLKCRQLWS